MLKKLVIIFLYVRSIKELAKLIKNIIFNYSKNNFLLNIIQLSRTINLNKIMILNKK